MFLEVYFSKVALIITTETDRCKVGRVPFMGFIKQLYIAFIHCIYVLLSSPETWGCKRKCLSFASYLQSSRVVDKNE